MKNLDRRQFVKFASLTVGAVLIESCVPKASLPAPTLEPSSTSTPQPQPTSKPVNNENHYIAYCGNNCAQCPQYENECPKGCLGETCVAACSSCSVRRCAIRNKVANCATCDKYPCETLEKQYENMKSDGFGSWAKMAKAVLETVNQSK